MTGLISLIVQQIPSISFNNPLSIFDLFLALFLVLAFFAYIYRFPAFRVVIGVVILFIFSGLFFLLHLIITAWLIGVAANLILIALPLIFAQEIRHYLEKLGRLPFIKMPPITKKQKTRISLSGLAGAVYDLAGKNIGASIVLARKTGVGETIETGVRIDARFSSKLLESIFFPKSPLHDGAVVIREGIIVAAKCLLPISGEVKLEPPFGTRHSSAIGITKDTDAVVIVVSEQRGEVSLMENGRMHVNLKKDELSGRLKKLLIAKD